MDKWIPISEDWPKEGIDALVRNSDGETQISCGAYSIEADDFMWYTGDPRFGEVIAWKPLSKSYNRRKVRNKHGRYRVSN